MKSDEDQKTPRLFDVRTIERNIRKGLTTRKDYEKYLKSLPDAAEKAAPLETSADEGLDDIDDDDLDDIDDDEDDDTTTPGSNGVSEPPAS
jgi:hypothetical protein